MTSSLLVMTKQAKGQVKKVTRHNDLIEAKMDLSTMQLRIFLGTVVQIKKEDVAFKPYQIVIKELLDDCGVKSNNWYETLREEAESLSEVKLKLPVENKKDFLYTNLFSSVRYRNNLGVLELSFDPALKPYLLQLKGNFTTYELQYVFPMKSQYSIRLYELLRQYATFGKRRFSLENLRYIFSLEDKYPNFADFKKRVIEPAKKECTKHSDITFSYKSVKQGRKVVALDFLITRKANSKDIEAQQKAIPIAHSDFVQELLDAGLSEQRVSEILDAYKKEDYLKFVWEKTKAQKPKKLDSFFLKALKDDYYQGNYAGLVAQKQKEQKKQELQKERKAVEQVQREFDIQFNAFYERSADRIEKETLSSRLEDKKEFESLLQEKIKKNPAWQISYDSYISGDMSLFRNFLVKKYGKEYEHSKEAYRKFIDKK
ncbi:replication initiation protein (plasmid) [Bernardetia sp. ABR2-2B]|uniref:replication initiation protein n=1 Tax=Bernardetia sp. ABR2-2B TaxID=3127472 RepID=UPI0030CE52A2